jgi:hypothetical protein
MTFGYHQPLLIYWCSDSWFRPLLQTFLRFAPSSEPKQARRCPVGQGGIHTKHSGDRRSGMKTLTQSNPPKKIEKSFLTIYQIDLFSRFCKNFLFHFFRKFVGCSIGRTLGMNPPGQERQSVKREQSLGLSQYWLLIQGWYYPKTIQYIGDDHHRLW